MDGMNQYERANAVWKVDGYYLRRNAESMEQAFERAKAELLVHLRRQIECCASLTFDQFKAENKLRNKEPTP